MHNSLKSHRKTERGAQEGKCVGGMIIHQVCGMDLIAGNFLSDFPAS